MKYYVHESSYVDEGAIVGDGTNIWHFSHVMSGAVIGKNCNIGQNVFIADDVIIGDNCKIQNNVSVYKGVVIEDDVFVGPSVVFTNVKNPRAFINRKSEYVSTIIKKGSTLGANCTILCGVTIGEYSFVGAGSVVTRDTMSKAVYIGVPAKFDKWVKKEDLI